MAANDDQADTPLTPNMNNISQVVEQQGKIDQVCTSHKIVDQEERICLLKEQIQELRGVIQEMQQKLINLPTVTPATTTPITNSFTPVSFPSASLSYESMPPALQQQQYYDTLIAAGRYPYPYPYANPQIREQKGFDIHKQFPSCKPPGSLGEVDFNITKNWLRETVKTLNTYYCEEEQRKKPGIKQSQGEYPKDLSCKVTVSASSSSKGPPWCYRCKTVHSGSCAIQTCRCNHCGIIGHKAKDCKFPHNVCWNCFDAGHLASKCTVARKVGRGRGSGVGVVSESSLSMVGQKRKNPSSLEGMDLYATADEVTATKRYNTGMYSDELLVLLIYVCMINYG